MITTEGDHYREHTKECLRWAGRAVLYVVAFSAVVGALAGVLIPAIALWLT